MAWLGRALKPLSAALLALVVAPALVTAPAHATTPAHASAPVDASAKRVTPIAAARALPPGTVVTVTGTVTTPPGAFESSFFDKGFGLQDRSAGIYVSLPDALDVTPGRRVRVTGTLRDSFGLLILVPAAQSDVTLRPGGRPVTPEQVGTAAVGEATEGRIVQVRGKITQAPASDLPYGHKFFVNDGSGELQIFVNVQTGIDLSGLSVGQSVLVTGFSSQFETHYEIDPRSPDDIKVIG